MALEPTEEQRRQAILVAAEAIGRLSVWTKSAFSAESAVASLSTVVDVIWPLIRDHALEEAAHRCERQCGGDSYDETLAKELAQGIREMKGKP